MRARSVARALGLLTLGCVLVGLGLNFFAQRELEAQQRAYAREFLAVEPSFRATLDELAKSALFAPHPGGDAGGRLARQLRFERGGERRGPPPADPALVRELHKASDWSAFADDPRLDAVDLSWMRELQGAGFWSRPDDWVPATEDLGFIVRVRLLQGLRARRLAEAFAEVRHLERLLVTRERAAEVFALRDLVVAEARIFGIARARGLDLAGFELDDRHLADVNRVVWAAMGTRSLLATGPMTSVELGPFECLALGEAIVSAVYFAPLLRRGLRERYAALEADLRASRCRLPVERALLDGANVQPVEVRTRLLCSDPAHCDAPDLWLGWVPFVRLPLGVRALELQAWPSTFVRFKRAPPPPRSGGYGAAGPLD